jgi:PLP dependent protein
MIAENLKKIKQSLPEHCTLVAVSKFKSPEEIMEAYEAGHRDFGENRVQELAEKQAKLPKDIRWHMIGHIQTNKIKYFASFVHLVHGADRRKVISELSKQAVKDNVDINCLLQIHIAKEESKFGLDAHECMDLCKEIDRGIFPRIHCRGLMGMATFTDNPGVIGAEFNELKKLFDTIAGKYPHWTWDTLSMGMSNDYEIAIAAGSNMIRVGSAIFGVRET